MVNSPGPKTEAMNVCKKLVLKVRDLAYIYQLDDLGKSSHLSDTQFHLLPSVDGVVGKEVGRSVFGITC